MFRTFFARCNDKSAQVPKENWGKLILAIHAMEDSMRMLVEEMRIERFGVMVRDDESETNKSGSEDDDDDDDDEDDEGTLSIQRMTINSLHAF